MLDILENENFIKFDSYISVLNQSFESLKSAWFNLSFDFTAKIFYSLIQAVPYKIVLALKVQQVGVNKIQN